MHICRYIHWHVYAYISCMYNHLCLKHLEGYTRNCLWSGVLSDWGQRCQENFSLYTLLYLLNFEWCDCNIMKIIKKKISKGWKYPLFSYLHSHLLGSGLILFHLDLQQRTLGLPAPSQFLSSTNHLFHCHEREHRLNHISALL